MRAYISVLLTLVAISPRWLTSEDPLRVRTLPVVHEVVDPQVALVANGREDQNPATITASFQYAEAMYWLPDARRSTIAATRQDLRTSAAFVQAYGGRAPPIIRLLLVS